MNHILYLASKSSSRQMLLTEARIPFTAIGQDADETACMTGGTIEQTVLQIAQGKMLHAELPNGTHNGDVAYVLTADTMTQDTHGTIHGKPINRADAIAKIKTARAGNRVATGFCLEKRVWNMHQWIPKERIEKVVTAHYVFNIPDHRIEHYLDTTISLQCAGASAVEGFGAQFLHTIEGSHSCIIGLPLYELRQALEQLGFFDK